MDEDGYAYDDEQFEEDEVTPPPPPPHPPRRTSSDELEAQQQSGLCSWKAIDLGEIELGEQLGGGSVGLVHRGTYRGELVALKTLVSEASSPAVVFCTPRCMNDEYSTTAVAVTTQLHLHMYCR